jgi:hypothetical protein
MEKKTSRTGLAPFITCCAILALGVALSAAVDGRVFAAQARNSAPSSIPVRYTDHWLTVLLIGTKSNRDGIGASLKLSSQGFVHIEQAKGGMSYMSASDPRIHFGLGKRSTIGWLEITWPSGQVDRLTNLSIDQIIAVKEGVGVIPRQFPKIPSPK